MGGTINDETLQLWDARTGLLLREIPANPSDQTIRGVPAKLAGVVIEGLNVSFEDPWNDAIGLLEESLESGAIDQEGVIPSPDGVAQLALRQAGNDQTCCGELARWFLAPAERRPVRPGASMPRRELADWLVIPDADPVQGIRVSESQRVRS